VSPLYSPLLFAWRRICQWVWSPRIYIWIATYINNLVSLFSPLAIATTRQSNHWAGIRGYVRTSAFNTILCAVSRFFNKIPNRSSMLVWKQIAREKSYRCAYHANQRRFLPPGRPTMTQASDRCIDARPC
jgi:hypothetical protein